MQSAGRRSSMKAAAFACVVVCVCVLALVGVAPVEAASSGALSYCDLSPSRRYGRGSGIMNWVNPVQNATFYTIRSGDSAAGVSADPTSYIPGELTPIHIRVLDLTRIYIGMVLYATNSAGVKVGSWTITNGLPFWTPVSCGGLAITHSDADLKLTHVVFFFTAPAGTGPVTFQIMIKQGEQNKGSFFYPAVKLSLTEAAVTDTPFIMAAVGQSCDAACATQATLRYCDASTTSGVADDDSLLTSATLASMACTMPIVAGCAPMVPYRDAATDYCYYRSTNCTDRIGTLQPSPYAPCTYTDNVNERLCGCTATSSAVASSTGGSGTLPSSSAAASIPSSSAGTLPSSSAGTSQLPSSSAASTLPSSSAASTLPSSSAAASIPSSSAGTSARSSSAAASIPSSSAGTSELPSSSAGTSARSSSAAGTPLPSSSASGTPRPSSSSAGTSQLPSSSAGTSARSSSAAGGTPRPSSSTGSGSRSVSSSTGGGGARVSSSSAGSTSRASSTGGGSSIPDMSSSADDSSSDTESSSGSDDSTVVIDGGWSTFSNCSAACDLGVKTRTCTAPAPSGGGAQCEGSSSITCIRIACGSPFAGVTSITFTQAFKLSLTLYNTNTTWFARALVLLGAASTTPRLLADQLRVSSVSRFAARGCMDCLEVTFVYTPSSSSLITTLSQFNDAVAAGNSTAAAMAINSGVEPASGYTSTVTSVTTGSGTAAESSSDASTRTIIYAGVGAGVFLVIVGAAFAHWRHKSATAANKTLDSIALEQSTPKTAAPAPSAVAMTPIAPTPIASGGNGIWSKMKDESTGHDYYYNNNTGESVWQRPADF